jgi:hypothetical protein
MLTDLMNTATEEELEALRVIYGDEAVRVLEGAEINTVRVDVTVVNDTKLRVHLTPSYPAEAPLYELRGMCWKGLSQTELQNGACAISSSSDAAWH